MQPQPRGFAPTAPMPEAVDPNEMMPRGFEEQEEAGEEEEDQDFTVTDLVSLLIPLASFANKAYMQAHLIHLNLEGPMFLVLHSFFKEQYEELVSAFDKLGEQVRTLDYLMPNNEEQLSSICQRFEHIQDNETKPMVATYIQNLTELGMQAKSVAAVAAAVDAIDVENYCADLVEFVFKSTWQLKATLR